MYASNEQEFNGEEKDWVFLPSSTPTANIVSHTMNRLNDTDDDDDDDDDDDGDSSSTSSGNSMTNICESLHRPSISSIESEQMLNTPSHCEELQSELATENAIKQTDQTTDENTISMSTDEIKEETCSASEELPTSNLIEFSPVINEYDLTPMENDSNRSFVRCRRHTGASDDQEEIPETMSTSTDPSSSTLTNDHPSSDRSNQGVALKLLIIIFLLTPFVLGPFLQSEQAERNLTKQTNQNGNVVSIDDVERILNKQIEEKFRILSEEKSTLLTQINDLYHLLNFTQESALNHINQLTAENKQLKEEIFSLKHRLEEDEKERKRCPKETERLSSLKSPLETLLNNVIQKTVSISSNDSTPSLSSLFTYLTSSLNELVNRTSETVKEKKRQSTTTTADPSVQSPVRQQAENFSSDSLKSKSQTNYLTWTRSRAEFREQARAETSDHEEKVSRRPWRWTFQRSDDRERLRHQPMTTKKWMGKKDHVCHSKFDFPRKQWCSVKHWLNKHIRP